MIADLQKTVKFDGEFEDATLTECLFLEQHLRRRKRRWLLVVKGGTKVDLEELGKLFECKLRNLAED